MGGARLWEGWLRPSGHCPGDTGDWPPLLPRSSGWLIACLSQAALPSGSSGFSPKSVIVGMCET